MKLLFVGDVMLGRLVNEFLKKEKDFCYPWGNTLNLLNKADFRFCNLECVISDRGEPWAKTPKAFHFRSDAKNIGVLKSAQINLVSLANNHVLDYGEDALVDTLNILSKNWIDYIGAGRDIYEAKRPVTTEADDMKIAFFAATDNEPDWGAGIDQPGINYLSLDAAEEKAELFTTEIESLKGEADLIIVSLHWGPNWGYAVPEEHRTFARHLIDSGADIVVGHSPHVFRGIEIYKKRPIFYSLGNFIDDYMIDPIEKNDQSFIFFVETKNKMPGKIILYPTLIQNLQAGLASGDIAEKIANKMIELSIPLGTNLVWNKSKERLECEIL